MIKGYEVPDGFMGLVKGKYQLFASENDYLEYVLINEEVQEMLDFRDFYCIADYANMNWKGGYSAIEIAENAYNYLRDFEWSKENGKVANSIKVLLTNLDEDIANGEELEYVKYWTSEIRKELDLNQ